MITSPAPAGTVLIQPAMVILVPEMSRLGLFGISANTAPPSKVTALPTWPAPQLGSALNVASLELPLESAAVTPAVSSNFSQRFGPVAALASQGLAANKAATIRLILNGLSFILIT